MGNQLIMMIMTMYGAGVMHLSLHPPLSPLGQLGVEFVGA